MPKGDPYHYEVPVYPDSVTTDWVRERVESLCPLPLAPAIWDIQVTGRRAIVKREVSDSMSSGSHGTPIIIPGSVQRPVAAGYVINIGPLFGTEGLPTERGGFYEILNGDPANALGQYVIFGEYVGQDLIVDCKEQRYETEFLILQEWEIWGIVNQKEKE